MNWEKQTISVLLSACVLIPAATPVVAIPDEEVGAPAAILVEVKTGKVLYGKNFHGKYPTASITKVITLLLIVEATDFDRIALTDAVSASARTASMGGSDIWLQQGETMSIDDLIKATMIMSANDAAVALTEHVTGTENGFLCMMNDRAKGLRMNGTTFKNCNDLDEDSHLTSADDVALMSAELLKHEKVTEYALAWIDHVRGGKTQLVSTNKLIKSYKGIIGLKTGTTGKADSCISASAARGQVSLVAVILGSSTTGGRFSSTARLLDYGFTSWSMATPEKPELQKVPIANGMQSSVELETIDSPALLVPKGEKSEVVSQIVVADPLEAPIESEQIIGKITYKLGGETFLETDIRAKAAAEKMTFFSVFRLLCMGMVCF